uniref:Uncharacterized protein n=1 Tax=Solanum tuberosum TaxID=4113 RepID=M1DAD1_SOLTU
MDRDRSTIITRAPSRPVVLMMGRGGVREDLGRRPPRLSLRPSSPSDDHEDLHGPWSSTQPVKANHRVSLGSLVILGPVSASWGSSGCDRGFSYLGFRVGACTARWVGS